MGTYIRMFGEHRWHNGAETWRITSATQMKIRGEVLAAGGAQLDDSRVWAPHVDEALGFIEGLLLALFMGVSRQHFRHLCVASLWHELVRIALFNLERGRREVRRLQRRLVVGWP